MDIYIYTESFILSGSIIFTYDYCRRFHKKTNIGKKSFILARAIILPGFIIDNQVIVGAGSVVKKDIKSNYIVA